MRIRNNKIHVFENNINKTETPILLFSWFLFGLIYIGLWLLMYGLYTEIGDISLPIFIGVILFFILLFIYRGLSNGSFEEEVNIQKYKIKKGRKNDFLKNINVLNHQNYFKPNKFYTYFLRYILYGKIIIAVILNIPMIILSLLFYIMMLDGSASHQMESSGDIIFIVLFVFPIVFYFSLLALREYFHIKKIINSGSACMISSKISKYYIDKDKIFFY